MVSASQIVKKFPDLVIHSLGPLDTSIRGPCSMEAPLQNSICFVGEEKYLETTLNSPVSVLVVKSQLREKIKDSHGKCILISENIHVAMARINSEFFSPQILPKSFDEHFIHPSCVVSKNARIADDVIIGPNSVISEGVHLASGVRIGANTTLRENVKVGKNTCLGSNTVIEPHALIGENCNIYSQVFIGRHCQIGNHCIIQAQTAVGSEGYGYGTDKKNIHFHKPHYGKVILEDRVEVGAGVFIDRGTFEDSILREGTKIDNYCHLGHNLDLGRNNLITAGFISAGSVKIGDNCVFAGRTSVNGHLKIADNLFVGPLSGVSSGIEKSGQYGGWPLQTYKESIKTLATLRFLTEMKKDLVFIKKKLGLSSED